MGIRSLATLRQVAAAFRAERIDFAPLKGPILAARLYGEYTQRPTSDVDVLIRRADFDRARRSIESIGGGLEPSYASQLQYHRRFHHNVGFSIHGVVLEIHERANTHFGARFPSEPLLDRARTQRLAGEDFSILDPSDELVFLAVHAAGHYFPRDNLLLDLKMLAQKQNLDLREVEARAREFGVGRAVGASLVLANARAGFDLGSMSRPWRVASQARIRIWPEGFGTESAQSHRDVIRNLFADTLWSDGAIQGARFLGERGWYHLARRIKRSVLRN